MSYKSVELYYEPRNTILPKLNLPPSEPEMSEFDSAFLCGILRDVHPEKILEVGVAGGGTTAIIMQCMAMQGWSYELHSIDLSEKLWCDESLAVGFLAEEAKKFISGTCQRTYLGKLATEWMSQIGGDIDCLILDTAHCLPGEVLEFLALLEYLRDGAVVVLHDLANNFCMLDRNNFRERANATKLLFDSVTAEKYLVCDSSAKVRGGMPNIGAFHVSKATREHLADVVGLLTSTWLYMPAEEQMAIYREAVFRGLDEECQWLYDCAVKMNKSIMQAPLDFNATEVGYHFLRELVGIPKYVPMKHENKTFIIYGAGKRGKSYAEYLLRNKINNFFFCDAALAGGKIFDIDIITPQKLLDYVDADVVISSSRYGLDIYKYLRNAGVDKDRIYLMQ